MKRFILCFSCLVFAMLFVSPVQAADMYFAARGGATVPMDSTVEFDPSSALGDVNAEFEFKPGFSFAAAIGGYINENMRFEPEISYQKNDVDKADGISVNGDFTIWTFLVNGYYDFNPDSDFSPYVGGGIGFARIDTSRITSPQITNIWLTTDEDSVFAYQVCAGAAWELSEGTKLDAMYRYFGSEGPHFSEANAEFGSHNLYIGVRQEF